ncbi:MAG: GTPase ObgE, partial [Cyanobacteriota bacterium]
AHGLTQKPRLVGHTTADLLRADGWAERGAPGDAGGGGPGRVAKRPLVISAATSKGLEPLLEAVWHQLEAAQSS